MAWFIQSLAISELRSGDWVVEKKDGSVHDYGANKGIAWGASLEEGGFDLIWCE